jgi:hypothetical protein
LEDAHKKMFHDVKFLLQTYNEKQWSAPHPRQGQF